MNEVYFLTLKLYCSTFPQLFQSYNPDFLHMEISTRTDAFYHSITVCMRINLISLPKQPSNKANTITARRKEITNSVIVSFNAIYCKGLKLC